MRMNHAVLYVRDASASASFYRDVLGFTTKIEGNGFAFLLAPNSKNDHDLGLFSIGAEAETTDAGRRTTGLYHVAWQVETLGELAAVGERLRDAGSLVGATNHGSTRSLYAKDIDGIEFEVMWLVPAHLLTEIDTGSGMQNRPLDLTQDIARFGPDVVSVVPN